MKKPLKYPSKSTLKLPLKTPVLNFEVRSYTVVVGGIEKFSVGCVVIEGGAKLQKELAPGPGLWSLRTKCTEFVWTVNGPGMDLDLSLTKDQTYSILNLHLENTD